MFEFRKYFKDKVQLTDAQLSTISDGLLQKKIKKNTFLLQPGDICKEAFFVSKGLLRSYTINSSGKENIIQFAPEDWFIVDRDSFYFNQPSALFIDAVEDSEIVCLDTEFFKRAESLSPAFISFNVISLHNVIRHMQKRISLLLGATAEERYLDFIKLYPNVTLRVPQWMIASYLGITPESLSRVRKELANKNFKTN